MNYPSATRPRKRQEYRWVIHKVASNVGLRKMRADGQRKLKFLRARSPAQSLTCETCKLQTVEEPLTLGMGGGSIENLLFFLFFGKFSVCNN